jgi:hypothetical protein
MQRRRLTCECPRLNDSVSACRELPQNPGLQNFGNLLLPHKYQLLPWAESLCTTDWDRQEQANRQEN